MFLFVSFLAEVNLSIFHFSAIAIFSAIFSAQNYTTYSFLVFFLQIFTPELRARPEEEPVMLAGYSHAFHAAQFNPVEPRLVVTANQEGEIFC